MNGREWYVAEGQRVSGVDDGERQEVASWFLLGHELLILAGGSGLQGGEVVIGDFEQVVEGVGCSGSFSGIAGNGA